MDINANSKKDLFIKVLDMWLYSKYAIIGECSSNIEEDKEQALMEYEKIKQLYDNLES